MTEVAHLSPISTFAPVKSFITLNMLALELMTKVFICMYINRKFLQYACFEQRAANCMFAAQLSADNTLPQIDPSAAPPTAFWLTEVNSGWRAAINSAGGGAKIFRRRRIRL
jgi:hypothetical protein